MRPELKHENSGYDFYDGPRTFNVRGKPSVTYSRTRTVVRFTGSHDELLFHLRGWTLDIRFNCIAIQGEVDKQLMKAYRFHQYRSSGYTEHFRPQ